MVGRSLDVGQSCSNVVFLCDDLFMSSGGMNDKHSVD